MAAFKGKFGDLLKQTVDEQATFFSRRFVFSLQDKYSDVFDLAKKFKAAVESDTSAKGNELSQAGAPDFLQKNGKTRTALQRKQELQDIDFNKDSMIGFIEYLLLHYKVMILKEHFARKEEEPSVDLENDGVGLTGVGHLLIEELFAPPQGIDPELEKMMSEFSIEHAKRETKIRKLKEKVEIGGVKGMAAKNELEQLQQTDETEMNAVEARIAAAIKKAQKKSEKELAAKNKAADDAKAAKLAEGRNKLADKAKMFAGK